MSYLYVSVSNSLSAANRNINPKPGFFGAAKTTNREIFDSLGNQGKAVYGKIYLIKNLGEMA